MNEETTSEWDGKETIFTMDIVVRRRITTKTINRVVSVNTLYLYVNK